MRPRFLNKDEFAQVVRNTPLVSIDLIIRDPDQHVLVGLRTSEPAKGKWFVPGGVVRKYERLADAFARIVKAEIGLDASIDDAKFVGVYEHLYDDNVFGEEGFGTHYVVLAHQLNLDHQPPIMSDRQHNGFRWMTPAELISSPDVHPNTRAYFL
jgi:colanic acid biosynthesis protein WcaH